MKLWAKATVIFDRITDLLALLAGVLLVFMMLAVCYEVVMRYFLNRPQGWVVEVTVYCLIYITFLGAAWLLKRDGHVRMDLVLNRLKPRTHALVNIITSVLGAIICFVVTWFGVKVTWGHFQAGYVLWEYMIRPPSFVTLIVIPVSSSLLFIQFLRRARGFLGKLESVTR